MAYLGNFDSQGRRRINGEGTLFAVAATTSSGASMPVPATTEGHLEVAIHGPVGAFGEVLTTYMNPVLQIDAVYGINTRQVFSTVSGIGTAGNGDNMFQVSTAGGIGSFGTIQSRRRLRYRAGQGLICRFTARFTSPLASTYQLVGFGHAEDGLYVGYNGLNFGILYSKYGKRTINRLTITAGATSGGNVLINGTSVAVTNSSSITRTAWEISKVAIPGYTGACVHTEGGVTYLHYVSSSAIDLAVLTFDANGTGATATVAKDRSGAAATDTWIYQSAWNVDTMDGNGNSASTLDPTKLNVYEFKIQYLGAGAFQLSIETNKEGNNSNISLAHVIVNPNTLIKPSFGTPVFPFTMAAYDLGVGNNVTAYCASVIGAIEGATSLTGNRGTITRTLGSTVTAAANWVLFSVHNDLVFQGKPNQCQIIPTLISCAVDHNQPVTFYLVRSLTAAEITFTGNPSFVPYDSSTSVANTEVTATQAVYAQNQIVWAGSVGSTGTIVNDLFDQSEDISLQPGEYLTCIARTAANTAQYVTATLIWREDV